MVGYSNTITFINNFKKVKHMPPGKYFSEIYAYENLILENKRENFVSAKVSFHRNFKYALISQRLAQDVSDHLDPVLLDNLFNEWDKIQQKYSSADFKLDAYHHIIMPGLVNSHCHSAECLERYLGADRDLLTWLTTSKWPFQGNLTPEDAYQEARLGLLENLRFGNTTIVENYYPPKKSKKNVDRLIHVAQDYGVSVMAPVCVRT